MWKFVGKRLLMAIPVLFCVAIFVFVLMYFVPGDPATIILGDTNATEVQIEALREELGLNRSFAAQLLDYLNDLVHFEFGTSYIFETDVGDQLVARFPYTIKLALYSMGIAVIIAIPLGIACALNAGKLIDRAIMVISLFFCSMPGFWLGLLMIVLFSAKLGWLPSNGVGTWKHYIMPIATTAIAAVAAVCRHTRSSMLEVIRSDFVTTARSKGLSERKIIYGHALPNALIPIITIVGTNFSYMMGGTVVTESVFSIPGIGKYVVDSINARDYPVVRGSVFFLAVVFTLIMLMVDLIFAFVDPRIRAQFVKAKNKQDETAPDAESAET